MYISTITLHIILIFGDALCRGPHHPRGDSVAKHHIHHKPTKDINMNIIQDSELLHDKEHLQEHLEEIIDKPDLDKLTNEELDFYYFQVHDVDRNNKLDGLEILQAIQHTHHDHDDESEEEQTEYDKNTLAEEIQTSLEYYTELIDKVFLEDDLDNDGYLTYAEYKAGREIEVKLPTGRKSKDVSVDQLPSVSMS